LGTAETATPAVTRAAAQIIDRFVMVELLPVRSKKLGIALTTNC
jgi:hypothetical protein